MAHIKKENKAEALFDFVIYVIVSPIDEKKIYISQTGQHRLRKHYTEHVNLRVPKTEKMFSSAIEAGELPPIYILEANRISKKEAGRRCVAWLKYFLDHGYSQCTEDNLTAFANDLLDQTKQTYDQIKEIPLDEILQPDGGVLRDYKFQAERKNNKTGILLHVEVDEYETIKRMAEEEGLSMNAYCKQMALNKRILRVDLSFIGEYMSDFSEVKNLIKQILYTICMTGKYLPADLQNIQNSVDRMTELQEKVNEQVSETIRILRE